MKSSLDKTKQFLLAEIGRKAGRVAVENSEQIAGLAIDGFVHHLGRCILGWAIGCIKFGFGETWIELLRQLEDGKPLNTIIGCRKTESAQKSRAETRSKKVSPTEV
jgi:hypothetical protein